MNSSNTERVQDISLKYSLLHLGFECLMFLSLNLHIHKFVFYRDNGLHYITLLEKATIELLVP